MKELFGVIIIAVCLSCNSSRNMVLQRSVPLVRCNDESFVLLMDSLFSSKKHCDYYSDSLYLRMLIIEDPDKKSCYGIQFEAQDNIEGLFVKPLMPIACFQLRNHYCFIYNKLPKDLFVRTKSNMTFCLRNEKAVNENSLVISSYEDDSYTQWLYYFENGSFKLLGYYPCNLKSF